MKQKNKLLIILSAVFLLAAITSWALGYNPLFVIVLGLLVLFMFFVLWDMPPKHKDSLIRTSRGCGDRSIEAK